MNRFASNPSRHPTVWAVLLVWLLASGSSWASLCLMQEYGSPWDGISAGAFLSVTDSQSSPGHALAGLNHHEHGMGVEKACHDVFRDSTHGIVNSASRNDLAHAEMFTLVVHTWAAFPGVTAATSSFWPDLPASNPAVPLRTRLSRLTL